jgi:hypothetical protein
VTFRARPAGVKSVRSPSLHDSLDDHGGDPRQGRLGQR